MLGILHLYNVNVTLAGGHARQFTQIIGKYNVALLSKSCPLTKPLGPYIRLSPKRVYKQLKLE